MMLNHKTSGESCRKVDKVDQRSVRTATAGRWSEPLDAAAQALTITRALPLSSETVHAVFLAFLADLGLEHNAKGKSAAG